MVQYIAISDVLVLYSEFYKCLHFTAEQHKLDTSTRTISIITRKTYMLYKL